MKPITTILERAATRNLTTLERAKLALKLTKTDDDEFLETLVIPACSGRVDRFCNRVFARQKYQDLFRLHSHGLAGWAWGRDGVDRGVDGGGLGRLPISLSNVPVRQVLSFKEDDAELVEGTDFEIDRDSGLLFRLCPAASISFAPIRIATIVYLAGYAVPPDDGEESLILDAPEVEEATLELVAGAYKGRGRDPSLRSWDQPDVGNQVYWVGGPPSTGGLPESVADKLGNFVLPSVG
jgi:hypothetical protein